MEILLYIIGYILGGAASATIVYLIARELSNPYGLESDDYAMVFVFFIVWPVADIIGFGCVCGLFLLALFDY